MTSLLELQRAFARAVVAGDDSIAGLVIGNRFSGAERINIYRNNVQESLTVALGDVYPVIMRLVGEDFFRHATQCYVREHPPRQGSLIHFGGKFASFLRDFRPAAELAYLEDVARLEWAWHEVYHAHHGGDLEYERLARLGGYDAERLRFRLSPAARLIYSRYPILRIWEVNQPAHEEIEMVGLDDGPDHLLVLRNWSQVAIVPLEPGEFAFLDALANGAELGEACQVASAADTGLDPGRVIVRHVEMQTITDIVLPLPSG